MKTRNWIVLAAASLALVTSVFAVRSTARAKSHEEIKFVAGHIRFYRDLLGLVEDYARIAADPSTAGVAAVLSVKDHLPDVSDRIRFFEERADVVKDPVVARAIRIKLIELYKNKNTSQEKRVEQLDRLINP